MRVVNRFPLAIGPNRPALLCSSSELTVLAISHEYHISCICACRPGDAHGPFACSGVAQVSIAKCAGLKDTKTFGKQAVYVRLQLVDVDKQPIGRSVPAYM